MSSTELRVGLLTGTFDPVHLGHIALARAAQTACKLDEVWFLVNPYPGHKKDVTALTDRLAMVQLALEVEPDLKLGETVPHTMGDFEALTGRMSGTEFIFIVGSDVLESISTWEEQAKEVVIHQARFAAVSRLGQRPLHLVKGLRVEWFEMSGYRDISSGRVRAQLERAEVPPGLSPQVYKYICDHGLYT